MAQPWTILSNHIITYFISFVQQTLKDEHCMIIFCATAIAIESS